MILTEWESKITMKNLIIAAALTSMFYSNLSSASLFDTMDSVKEIQSQAVSREPASKKKKSKSKAIKTSIHSDQSTSKAVETNTDITDSKTK